MSVLLEADLDTRCSALVILITLSSICWSVSRHGLCEPPLTAQARCDAFGARSRRACSVARIMPARSRRASCGLRPRSERVARWSVSTLTAADKPSIIVYPENRLHRRVNIRERVDHAER